MSQTSGGAEMHVIVVGCGRVGVAVARALDVRGHSVVVIDRKADAFRRLGGDFGGRTMTGVGFDRGVLQEAGIAPGCAVTAVTSGDNSNILIARVARETFGVERVVARIYDPKRAAIYERLGIPTIASVTWSEARIMRYLLPHDAATEWIDPTSTFHLAERRVGAKAAGIPVAEIDAAGMRVCLLARGARAQLPPPQLLLQEDDVIHVLVAADGEAQLDAALDGSNTGGHS